MTTGPDWAEQVRRLLEVVKTAPTEGDGEAAAGECKWCPHCQLLAVLRGERPEVSAVIDDLLATASAALRNIAGDAPPPEPAAPADEPVPSPPAPEVQRIELA